MCPDNRVCALTLTLRAGLGCQLGLCRDVQPGAHSIVMVTLIRLLLHCLKPASQYSTTYIVGCGVGRAQLERKGQTSVD